MNTDLRITIFSSILALFLVAGGIGIVLWSVQTDTTPTTLNTTQSSTQNANNANTNTTAVANINTAQPTPNSAARIVFAADFATNGGCADHSTSDVCDLFTANINLSTGVVSNVVQLTNTPTTSESYPAWNPNGEMVYATVLRSFTDKSIVYADLSTGETATLVGQGAWPEVSPDGSTFVYDTSDTSTLMRATLSTDGKSISNATALTGTAQQSDANFSADGNALVFHQIENSEARGAVLDLSNNSISRVSERTGHCAFGGLGEMIVCDNAKGGGLFAEDFVNHTLSAYRLFLVDARPATLAEYDPEFAQCAGASFNYPTFCGDDSHLLVSTSCNAGTPDGVAFSRLFLIDLSSQTPVYHPIGKDLAEQFGGSGSSSWTLDCMPN